MRAKDYYEEFASTIYDNPEKGQTELYGLFAKEALDFCEARGVTDNASVSKIIKELNQKWNALERIFWYKHPACDPPIQRDFFLNCWRSAFPLLKDLQ